LALVALSVVEQRLDAVRGGAGGGAGERGRGGGRGLSSVGACVARPLSQRGCRGLAVGPRGHGRARTGPQSGASGRCWSLPR